METQLCEPLLPISSLRLADNGKLDAAEPSGLSQLVLRPLAFKEFDAVG